MEKKVFCSCFCIIISSPTPSNTSQNNTEVLEMQQQEMQWRHKEEQQLLLQLEKVAKLCQAEHAAQKARRKAEAKAREESKRKRVVEEEKKKKRTLEYLQQLWDEVLEEDAAFLEGAEGSKHKEVATIDEERQKPSKKTKGKQQEKYHRGTTVKMGDANSYERCVSTEQDCLMHHSRWVVIIIIIITFSNNFFFIADLSHILCTSPSSSGRYSIPAPTPQP